MSPPKRILNLSEAQTHESLRKVAEAWSAHVFPKVRMADVLRIENSGVDDSLYSFALKAHFDFVVTDQDFQPAFAVEFDGVGHIEVRQITRDQQKDALCEQFEFPLLRINANYLPKRFERTDLLTWFATAWFCEREHTRLQRLGEISHDDPFDPRFVITCPGHLTEFPLWISRRGQGKLRKAFFDGKVIDFCASVIVIRDEERAVRSLAWILVTQDAGVISRTAFRPNLFHTGLVEAAEQIAMFGLWQEVEDVLEGAASPIPRLEIQREIDRYGAAGSLLFAFGGGKLQVPTFRRIDD
jgi:Protein of unknown function (DUF2726)